MRCGIGSEAQWPAPGSSRATGWRSFAGEGPPNGSRLSCGRPARRRKSVGRQSVPARAQHSASLRAITARQLQALVRHPAHGISLALPNVPTDACQVDQIDFPPPRMVGRTTEPNTRVGLIEPSSRNGLPPAIQIVNVEPNHEILCKVLVVEPLENELCTAVSEPSVAIILPHLLETKVCEETTTGLVILAAGNEW